MDNRSGISGLVKSTLFSDATDHSHHAENRPIVVTVSREFGSNGGKIAELLAEQLHVPCYGYSMIDQLVQTSHTTNKLISLMDEKLPRAIDAFLYSLFIEPEQSVAGYYKNLIKAVNRIAQTGGVILGRGARLILADHPHVFRVRIEGSRDICIQRIAQREGITTDAAKEKLLSIEKERSRFLKGLYKRFPNRRTYYDLVINSDRIEPLRVAAVIVQAMEGMGFLKTQKSSLPEAAPLHHAPLATPPVSAEQTHFRVLQPGLHFLIVEDEPEFVELVRGWLNNPSSNKDSALRMPSLTLTHAATFRETEQRLAEQHFDLILLDLNLSDSHGYEETFGRLNQKHLETPIILFTGIDDEQKAIQSVDEGAQDYLVKGQITRKTLVRSIRHALSRYRILKGCQHK
ncbi:cytidylate kinase family protein [Candidatus Magnetaquicoccus inordinatus]|uniref:cytidylate kinase family protein n=1 Tax=Candidatus Magnetaquicoccus inordinatus TaxID=2496818 RepID=UPI00102B46A6|nr:cytidylate kinase family protein [Candidatus Magnetaquicoccus inordinatus]